MFARLPAVKFPDLPGHGSGIHASKQCRPYFEIVAVGRDEYLPHLRGFLWAELLQQCGKCFRKKGLLLISVFRDVGHNSWRTSQES